MSIHTFQKSSVDLTQKSVSQAILTLWQKSERESRHIVSGRSMLPFIGDGAKVVIKHTLDGIKTGSIIAFRKDKKIITHRVMRIYTQGQKLCFETKGDFSARIDPLVSQEDIVGRVISVEKWGRVISLDNWLLSTLGYFAAVSSFLFGRIRGVFRSYAF